MFRIIAEEIVLFMLRHRWLNQAKREIYEYAIEVMLLNGGLLVINLMLSIVFNQIPFFLAFLIIFAPIRKYLGGLHLRNSGLCMVCSVIFYVLVMLANRIIFFKYRLIELMIVIFLSLICLVLKPLPEKVVERKRHNKQIANGIIIADLLVICMGWKMDLHLVSAFALLDISALLFFLFAKIGVWLQIEDRQKG